MAFRYYKLQFTAGNSTAIMVDEVEMYVGATNVALNVPVVVDGTYPSFQTSWINNGGAWGQQWQYNAPYPHFAQFDLGASKALDSYRLRVATQLAYNPTAWTLYGSNDTVTWYVIDARSGVTWSLAQEWNSYTVSGWKNIAGVVLDANGVPVSRKIRAYLRSNGYFSGESQSDPGTGAYALKVWFAEEYNLFLLDDALGTLENDQILRVIPV